MTSLRAAVLVFVLGASIANFFAVKERLDLLGSEPTSSANDSDIFGSILVGPSPKASRSVETPSPEPTQSTQGRSPEQAMHDTLVAEAYDEAWMREAIIVTVGGVAWFVLRALERRERA